MFTVTSGLSGPGINLQISCSDLLICKNMLAIILCSYISPHAHFSPESDEKLDFSFIMSSTEAGPVSAKTSLAQRLEAGRNCKLAQLQEEKIQVQVCQCDCREDFTQSNHVCSELPQKHYQLLSELRTSNMAARHRVTNHTSTFSPQICS